MKTNELDTLFEDCLQRLQRGEDLEQILADTPAQAAALRPLLQMAAQLTDLPVPTTPAAARNARRAQFLAAAASRRPQTNRRAAWQPLRTLVTSLVLLLVVAGSLLGSGLASAQALPGDTLYPVKRAVENTRLALSTNSLDRLKLDENFDQQRTREAALLVESQRREKVSFHGVLEQDEAGIWRVGGLAVLTQDANLHWAGLTGSQVEVVGQTRPEGVEVEALQLRLFHLSGDIEQISPTEWLVSGVPLDLSPASRINGPAQIGAKAHITAVQLQPGRFLALSILVETSQAPVLEDVEDAISLSDWVTLSNETEDSESGSADDHSNATDDHSGSSSDDSEKTPEPEKTQDSD